MSRAVINRPLHDQLPYAHDRTILILTVRKDGELLNNIASVEDSWPSEIGEWVGNSEGRLRSTIEDLWNESRRLLLATRS